MDLYEEFGHLVDALNQADVPFAVCGGVAVVLYGHVRATTDVDLLVPADQVHRAMASVRTIGYGHPALPMAFDAGTPTERRVHRVSKVVDKDTLTLDLITVGPALQTVWETRRTLQWKGRHLPIVSREGLARMKRLAGRLQDLADLESLGLCDG